MVNCKILSVLESEPVDAYLLSESSMFVFPHKIILKTCGTTTLLLGLQRLLHIAAAEAGFPFHNTQSATNISAAATPYRFFYSRKNFLFPDKQRGPHRSWKQEVRFLDDMLENGSAYMVGRMNGDHWYLYLTSPQNTALTPPRTPPESDGATDEAENSWRIPSGTVHCFPAIEEEASDETLEILMTDLDPENAKQFFLAEASAVASDKPVPHGTAAVRGEDECDAMVDVFSNDSEEGLATPLGDALTTEGHALGSVVSETCGLASVYPQSRYPDARIDAYMFGPCGFSANGIVPVPQQLNANSPGEEKSAAHYFTVHVTPEPNCSFASFETNIPGGKGGRATGDIIEHVVAIFKPGRFSVTLFEAKVKRTDPYGRDDGRAPRRKAATQRLDPVRGYRRVERILHEFDDYYLVFRYYERDDWVGVGPRVGEDED